jgi:hypothetical protein
MHGRTGMGMRVRAITAWTLLGTTKLCGAAVATKAVKGLSEITLVTMQSMTIRGIPLECLWPPTWIHATPPQHNTL